MQKASGGGGRRCCYTDPCMLRFLRLLGMHAFRRRGNPSLLALQLLRLFSFYTHMHRGIDTVQATGIGEPSKSLQATNNHVL